MFNAMDHTTHTHTHTYQDVLVNEMGLSSISCL